MLCYVLFLQESFERVGTWIKQCEDMCGGDITKVLVGNKADLESKREVPHDVAKVSQSCTYSALQKFFDNL